MQQVGTIRRAFAANFDWGQSPSAHRQHFAAMERIPERPPMELADFGLTGSQGDCPTNSGAGPLADWAGFGQRRYLRPRPQVRRDEYKPGARRWQRPQGPGTATPS